MKKGIWEVRTVESNELEDLIEIFEVVFGTESLLFEKYDERTGRSKILTFTELSELLIENEIEVFKIVGKMLQLENERVFLSHYLQLEGFEDFRVIEMRPI